MPPQKKPFNPYKPNQHETSKTARRNYLKRQSLNLGPSPSQQRAAELRIAASQRADEIKEKERKARIAKDKRLEKERKEREAQVELVRQGKLQPDALLPKVRSSQPRLNSFFVRPATKQAEEQNTIPEEAQAAEKTRKFEIAHPDQADSESNPDNCAELNEGNSDGEEATKPQGNCENSQVKRGQPLILLDEADLEAFLDSIPSSLSSQESETRRDDMVVKAHSHVKGSGRMGPPSPQKGFKGTHDEVDGQLLSEAHLDIGSNTEIFEDLDVEEIGTPRHSRSQNSRKRKARDFDDEDVPEILKRAIFSQMSPSKVNVRAQEKPNPMASAMNNGAISASPDLLDGLCTQDLDYDLDDIQTSDKENSKPSQIRKKDESSVKKAQNPQPSGSSSFEAALRDIGSSADKPRVERDSESDYGDIFDFDEDINLEHINLKEKSWIDDAVLQDLPPTPSKSKALAPPRINTTPRHPKQAVVSQDACFDTSFNFDDDELLEATIAAEQYENSLEAQPQRKKKRKIPWMDSSQKTKKPRDPFQRPPSTAGGKTVDRGDVGGESNAAANSWDDLEAMASTFEEDF